MDKVYIRYFRFGDLIWKITGGNSGISGIYPSDFEGISAHNQLLIDAEKQLKEYMVHIRTDFNIPLELRGTPFQKQVWETLRQIPYGKTVSYAYIAEQIGKPGAVRAVGQAIGKNPCLIVIPCHRVLGKNGSLTGFSAGPELKKMLLRHENADIML